jgi:hypothetical protein
MNDSHRPTLDKVWLDRLFDRFFCGGRGGGGGFSRWGEGCDCLTGEVPAKDLGVQTTALPWLFKRSNGVID